MEEKIIKVIDKVKEMYKYVGFMADLLDSDPKVILGYYHSILVVDKIIFSWRNFDLVVLPNKIEYRLLEREQNIINSSKILAEYKDFDELLSL